MLLKNDLNLIRTICSRTVCNEIFKEYNVSHAIRFISIARGNGGLAKLNVVTKESEQALYEYFELLKKLHDCMVYYKEFKNVKGFSTTEIDSILDRFSELKSGKVGYITYIRNVLAKLSVVDTYIIHDNADRSKFLKLYDFTHFDIVENSLKISVRHFDDSCRLIENSEFQLVKNNLIEKLDIAKYLFIIYEYNLDTDEYCNETLVDGEVYYTIKEDKKKYLDDIVKDYIETKKLLTELMYIQEEE